MSALSQFMHTARQVLDEQDRKASGKDQPPFFVRTTWLFAELEELGTTVEASLFVEIKIARLGNDIGALSSPLTQIETITALMPSGRQRHERGQLTTWIREQIERERV